MKCNRATTCSRSSALLQLVSEAVGRIFAVPIRAVLQSCCSRRGDVARWRSVAVGLLIGLCGSVQAQSQLQQPAASMSATADGTTDTASEIVRRYPPRSISTVTVAAAALDDISRQQIALEAMRQREHDACMPTFFTTSCLDKVREHYRHELALLRPIELEANAFNRRNRVAERDRVLDEKRVKAEQDAATGKGEVNIRQPMSPVPPAAPKSIPVPRQSKPLTPRIDAAQRAQNEAAFDRKAAESLQRQGEIAEKKAEKERERARKQAATTPSSP